jgi:hypothetical protein
MDGRSITRPITRTTNGRTLTLHPTPAEVAKRADRAARAELLAALEGRPRPSRRWQEMAQRTVRPVGIAPDLIVDAALRGHSERAMVRGVARAGVAYVKAIYAALRGTHPHLVTPPAPTPHPMRRRTDRRAA